MNEFECRCPARMWAWPTLRAPKSSPNLSDQIKAIMGSRASTVESLFSSKIKKEMMQGRRCLIIKTSRRNNMATSKQPTTITTSHSSLLCLAGAPLHQASSSPLILAASGTSVTLKNTRRPSCSTCRANLHSSSMNLPCSMTTMSEDSRLRTLSLSSSLSKGTGQFSSPNLSCRCRQIARKRHHSHCCQRLSAPSESERAQVLCRLTSFTKKTSTSKGKLWSSMKTPLRFQCPCKQLAKMRT